jgi:RimJ/RimL family protein N-acetyltransferase
VTASEHARRRLEPTAAITTERLDLVPLRIEDADEMAAVLADKRLHEFIGGRPATVTELREQYARLAAGSANPGERWLNWIVRSREDGQAVGTVQATLTRRDGHRTARVAWVIGVEWQGRGFATEAARALVDRVRAHGVDEILANIHPDHRASAKVACRAGLRPTEERADGEQVWWAKGRM